MLKPVDLEGLARPLKIPVQARARRKKKVQRPATEKRSIALGRAQECHIQAFSPAATVGVLAASRSVVSQSPNGKSGSSDQADWSSSIWGKSGMRCGP